MLTQILCTWWMHEFEWALLIVLCDECRYIQESMVVNGMAGKGAKASHETCWRHNIT